MTTSAELYKEAERAMERARIAERYERAAELARCLDLLKPHIARLSLEDLQQCDQRVAEIAKWVKEHAE